MSDHLRLVWSERIARSVEAAQSFEPGSIAWWTPEGTRRIKVTVGPRDTAETRAPAYLVRTPAGFGRAWATELKAWTEDDEAGEIVATGARQWVPTPDPELQALPNRPKVVETLSNGDQVLECGHVWSRSWVSQSPSGKSRRCVRCEQRLPIQRPESVSPRFRVIYDRYGDRLPSFGSYQDVEDVPRTSSLTEEYPPSFNRRMASTEYRWFVVDKYDPYNVLSGPWSHHGFADEDLPNHPGAKVIELPLYGPENSSCPDHSAHYENAADLLYPDRKRLTPEQDETVRCFAEGEYQNCEGH